MVSFVLFANVFQSYYAEYWDSPLYNPSRLERNMIDLSKITYLRAKSKQRDAPPFSFDIATIEREWTLCAESNDELQLWLQVVARAVDSDVAIVPDDTLSFAVKARSDPSRRLDLNDYSTTLQISAWGVSVQKLSSGEKEEVHFWCYTDFYKWSILRQNGKLALSLQIFTSSDFKHKHDFVFRSLDAQAIATAIEYYIEKVLTQLYACGDCVRALTFSCVLSLSPCVLPQYALCVSFLIFLASSPFSRLASLSSCRACTCVASSTKRPKRPPTRHPRRPTSWRICSGRSSPWVAAWATRCST